MGKRAREGLGLGKRRNGSGWGGEKSKGGKGARVGKGLWVWEGFRKGKGGKGGRGGEKVEGLGVERV